MGWFANKHDNPDPNDPSNEANRSPKYWDKRENKSRDAKNKDIDVKSPQGNDGNSSWWGKPDNSNKNPKKK